MKAGIIISIGGNGGFYISRVFGLRICLGFIAFTFIPISGDEVLAMASMYDAHRQALMSARKAIADELVYRQKDRRPPLAESEHEYHVTGEQLADSLGRVMSALGGEEG